MYLKKTLIMTIIFCMVGIAAADNGEFTVSGATQFDYFFSFGDNFPAATHDYIDIDNDGDSIKGNSTIDQLAATYTGVETEQQLLASGPWIMNYRGTGSIEGLTELIAFYNVAPPNDSTVDMNFADAIDGTVNRYEYSASNNYPFLPLDRIDIATMDVPTSQGSLVGTEQDSNPFRKPYQAGYGASPVTAWDGNSVNSHNKLADLGELNLYTGEPCDVDDTTVFDYPLAWLPFAFLASHSTGLENVTVEQLKCMYTTGRAPCGVNYQVGGRHSGSGSRNAAMSSIGVDPSWGRGDNLGITAKPSSSLGPDHQINNITSSSTLRDIHKNNRFMISYQSFYGSKGVGKINSGYYECLNVSFDCGESYVRPETNVDLSDIPDEYEGYDDEDHPWFRSNIFWPNTSNGWRIGGSETFASVGDPYATDLPSHLDSYETASHSFGMRNVDAAEFMINIVESIADVTELGPSPATAGSPGQALASKEILVAGVYGIPNPEDPTEFLIDPCDFNPALTGLPIANAGLDAFGSHGYGLLPVRVDGAYTTLAGGAVGDVQNDARYALQGDINQNGDWDVNDLVLGVDILEDPCTAAADDDISYDILCDFDHDGWFDENDLRYMADGVILSPADGKCACCCDEVVCRLSNFIVIDTASSNFFGTVLGNAGASYDAGDSRADIAKLVDGKVYAQAGAAPAADGIIDQTDISYIQKVLDGRLLSDTKKYDTAQRGGALRWLDPVDRIYADYSCDMNNDLIINMADLLIVIKEILETELGDFDLDGTADADDRNLILTNMGSAGTYVNGDITGDGQVNQCDLAMFDGDTVTRPAMDFNGDCKVDFTDFSYFAEGWMDGVQ